MGGNPLNYIDPTGEAIQLPLYCTAQPHVCIGVLTTAWRGCQWLVIRIKAVSLAGDLIYDVVAEGDDCEGDSCPTEDSDNERSTNPSKQDSPIWNDSDLNNSGGGRKDNGKKGKKRRYYEWDHTHDDIEVYDGRGKHKGSMDPTTGGMYKPPVPGRTINL